MSNSSATSRASRTQWRLFLVTACVLVPYMPLELYMTAAQFRTDMLSRGFDFHRIRQQVDDPFPWDAILLLPSSSLSFLELNHQYLAIATALPIFYFFGMTTDTTRTYRRVMWALGFGRVFPRLREGSAASGHTEQQPEAPWQEQIVLTPMKSAGDDGSQICPCDLEDITKPRSDWHHGHSQGPSNASDSSCPHDRAIMDSQSAIALPAKAHVYARSG
ncbi:pheromone receptor [Colletotrichum higginsianum]|uniref:Pheromone receptor n=3 Tax=Colletotrichum higginsianum TaxID=80884 RepID=H1VKI0_COLHI|nr:pheromone receptor [Colletotrichum higginsianum]